MVKMYLFCKGFSCSFLLKQLSNISVELIISESVFFDKIKTFVKGLSLLKTTFLRPKCLTDVLIEIIMA